MAVVVVVVVLFKNHSSWVLVVMDMHVLPQIHFYQISLIMNGVTRFTHTFNSIVLQRRFEPRGMEKLLDQFRTENSYQNYAYACVCVRFSPVPQKKIEQTKDAFSACTVTHMCNSFRKCVTFRLPPTTCVRQPSLVYICFHSETASTRTGFHLGLNVEPFSHKYTYNLRSLPSVEIINA